MDEKQLWCVGCGEAKEAEDLIKHKDGHRCLSCCSSRDKEAANAFELLPLTERIRRGRRILAKLLNMRSQS